MSDTVNLKIFKLTLLPSRPIKGNAAELRGFFATRFKEYPLLHQHYEDKFSYEYPLVQYKIIDGVPMLIGINEGVDTLKKIYNEFEEINLRGEIYKVIKTFSIKDQEFGMTEDKHSYVFLNPWFSLVQSSYNRYKRLRQEDKNVFLRKRLGSDIVRMSDELGYDVPEWIKGDVYVREMKSWFKGRLMTMFLGGFRADFLIPDYLGIGKSTSRGFGTIKLLG